MILAPRSQWPSFETFWLSQPMEGSDIDIQWVEITYLGTDSPPQQNIFYPNLGPAPLILKSWNTVKQTQMYICDLNRDEMAGKTHIDRLK